MPPAIHSLLERMVAENASDLYLTVDCPPAFRKVDGIEPFGEVLKREDIQQMMSELLTEDQIDDFQATLEFNSAMALGQSARFRINAFMQQQQPGLVIRKIQTKIPTFAELGLPPVYERLAMEKRGLVLVVGQTGSGKSSSLAAMIGHRNQHGSGHIITLEDPIEFVHQHQNCIITQRDIGIDSFSFGMALKNVLRQRPDVVLIGEIRDRETMEHALNFADTGHLCLATLHAKNSNQTIERILSFFPEEKQRQVLMNLSLNMLGVVAQRLLPTRAGGRCAAIEVMLVEGLIRQLIEEGKIKEIKPVMERHRDQGMQSFDQSLMDLFVAGRISEEVALAESDNAANLRLEMRKARMTPHTPQPADASGNSLGSVNRQHFKI